ncbi:hypothetical protein [Sulfitobacter sp. DSM 110093]|uniref:hypothetical protein n=1 Tax=Sulfitobacter sp. DSM 110093 TaxID=2883127 RepID=UPI001FAE463F|nr:hypothetical protein [Sulfitobacter sp. DSM 110093]
MLGDPGCILQISQESRLKDHPGTFGPEQDNCDITLWLNQRFPLSKARVLVGRHYTQRDLEIAGLAVTSSATHSVSLAPLAFEAFWPWGTKSKKRTLTVISAHLVMGITQGMKR